MTVSPSRPARPLSRGDLRLLVLALIAEQPRHGYELIQHVSALFVGAYTPSAGTMYPLLASFEQAGWVRADDEGGRRRFHITKAGQAELTARADDVRQAQHRAHHRAREIAKAAMPLPLREGLREFKQALLHHHGRWADGEAQAVAALLRQAAQLLNAAPAAASPDSNDDNEDTTP